MSFLSPTLLLGTKSGDWCMLGKHSAATSPAHKVPYHDKRLKRHQSKRKLQADESIQQINNTGLYLIYMIASCVLLIS